MSTYDPNLRPPETFEELRVLDMYHERYLLGDLWKTSERRKELVQDIRQRRMRKMKAEGRIPQELIVQLSKHNGSRVPLTVTTVDGQRKVIGEAVLENSSDGVIAKIEIAGEHAEDILKHGTQAFSIGYNGPTPEKTEEPRMSRWQRLLRRGK